MKKVDLAKERLSLTEVLTYARTDTVLIRSTSGEDFVLESADEFDREVTALGASEKFASFLDARSRETGDLPLTEVRQRRDMQEGA